MNTKNSSSLAILTNATKMLAECRTIQDAKKIADMASAAKVYAKKAQLGDEAIRYANEIRVEALRLLGDMLKQTERARGAKGIGPNAVPDRYHNAENPTLADMGLTKKESSAAQSLSTFAEKKPEVFAEAKQSGKSVSEILKPGAHVSNNSGENEWYTPPKYIEAARAVMGGIDCDPASSEIANRIVKAETFYTIQDDGLKQEWGKRIFMNPPYAPPLISKFCEAVTAKYESGEIEQACVLVNNATETAWFQRMLEKASAACFVRGRVKFLDINGNPGAPLQGQAVLYFGEDIEKFNSTFVIFGAILKK